MNALVTKLDSWSPCILSLLRIVAGAAFMEHGLSKFFGFPMPGPASLPPLLMVAGALEVVGGLLLAIGLLTRLIAFLLSGEMAVAYFMAHAPHSFYPLVNHGEAAVLYCFIFLYILFAGGGPWSVDRAIFRKA